jgi:hypothetical protein
LLKSPISVWLEWERSWKWIDTVLMVATPEGSHWSRYRLTWWQKLLGDFLQRGSSSDIVIKNWKTFTQRFAQRLFGAYEYRPDSQGRFRKITPVFSCFPSPPPGHEYLYDRNHKFTKKEISKWTLMT